MRTQLSGVFGMARRTVFGFAISQLRKGNPASPQSVPSSVLLNFFMMASASRGNCGLAMGAVVEPYAANDSACPPPLTIRQLGIKGPRGAPNPLSTRDGCADDAKRNVITYHCQQKSPPVSRPSPRGHWDVAPNPATTAPLIESFEAGLTSDPQVDTPSFYGMTE
jgi:hypothetical protein